MSLIEKGNWPASRAKAKARRLAELPPVQPTGWRPEVDVDGRYGEPGRVFTVFELPMAHEADMLRGNEEVS